MVWSEETILRLREFWEQGHSTAEIGRRLGVSKNAIVGKAHRLDLTARPSPIRREPSARPERPAPTFVRIGGPTLPPLLSASPSGAPALPPALRVTQAPLPRPAAPPPPPPPPVRAVSAPPLTRRSAPACCWPIGEPGKRDFRFCDGASVSGKPYCEEHARLAYVKIRDRKEDAA